jgi:hypothetical protein
MILMAALDQEANAIVEAGRRALQATSSDRDRIEATLRARLGLAALPLDVSAKPIAPSVFWRFGPGAAIGMCLVGCALFFALRAHHNVVALGAGATLQPSPSVPITAPAAATDSPSELAGTVAAVPTVSATAAPVAMLPSGSARQEDRLAQEVGLLLRATSALGAGRAGEALRALNEHQRRFPNGILSQERSAAKAQALCSLGQLSEGRAELAHLTPQSPAANRAKQVCDSISTAGE